jgi:hypothetical protein
MKRVYICNGKVPTCTKTTCKYLHPDLDGACMHTSDLEYSKTLLETGSNATNFEEICPGYFMEVEN